MNVATLKEPYRLEGKKTMGFELAEQLDWRCPTGSSTRPAAGPASSACGRRSRRWRPSAGSNQEAAAHGLGPGDGLRADRSSLPSGRTKAPLWEDPQTTADGLRVPKAIGDFLMLRILRESGGTGVTVADEEMIADMRALGALEGISAAPEGAATLSALRQLVAAGRIQPDETVVLFNTGGALKYLDVLA